MKFQVKTGAEGVSEKSFAAKTVVRQKLNEAQCDFRRLIKREQFVQRSVQCISMCAYDTVLCAVASRQFVHCAHMHLCTLCAHCATLQYLVFRGGGFDAVAKVTQVIRRRH